MFFFFIQTKEPAQNKPTLVKLYTGFNILKKGQRDHTIDLRREFVFDLSTFFVNQKKLV